MQRQNVHVSYILSTRKLPIIHTKDALERIALDKGKEKADDDDLAPQMKVIKEGGESIVINIDAETSDLITFMNAFKDYTSVRPFDLKEGRREEVLGIMAQDFPAEAEKFKAIWEKQKEEIIAKEKNINFPLTEDKLKETLLLLQPFIAEIIDNVKAELRPELDQDKSELSHEEQKKLERSVKKYIDGYIFSLFNDTLAILPSAEFNFS